MVAEAIGLEEIISEIITTEQWMSVYHGKGLSMLTSILTAEFFLNLADNGEFQRQRVNTVINSIKFI